VGARETNLINRDEANSEYIFKLLDEVCTRQLSYEEDFVDEMSGLGFCDRLKEYTWRYIDKGDRLVPYDCVAYTRAGNPKSRWPNFPEAKEIRWNTHHVWIVEGTLNGGESNVLWRRRIYIDEYFWRVPMGEGYDHAGEIVSYYMLGRTLSARTVYQGQWYKMS
jgi:hypothetical protein